MERTHEKAKLTNKADYSHFYTHLQLIFPRTSERPGIPYQPGCCSQTKFAPGCLMTRCVSCPAFQSLLPWLQISWIGESVAFWTQQLPALFATQADTATTLQSFNSVRDACQNPRLRASFPLPKRAKYFWRRVYETISITSYKVRSRPLLSFRDTAQFPRLTALTIPPRLWAGSEKAARALPAALGTSGST